MSHIGTDIKEAARLLNAGEVVAIPTETVYGLAGNAFDAEAIAKIYAVKRRPAYNPLIVHVADMAGMDAVAMDIPPLARRLAEVFWPGPLTLVLPKRPHVPDAVTAGLPTVGVRVPAHPLTLALLRALPYPLAAPSANPFGYISPTTAAHVEAQLGERIPYILDGGPCEAGIESTIIGFEDGMAVVYRLGALAPERLLAVVDGLRTQTGSSHKPISPGMLPYHYSPRTPMILTHHFDYEVERRNPEGLGLLSLNRTVANVPEPQQFQLSPSGDLEEAARNLYRHLHALDALGLELIIAEFMPETGLGPAINDRLRRAAAPKPG